MSLNLVSEQLLSANGLNHQDLFAILGQLTERRLDYGDLYFQSSYHESWVLEDSIIKDGSYNIDQGVGVRAVSGEKTGFAYADQISKLALEQSAQAARTIVRETGNGKVQTLGAVEHSALYTSIDPLQSMSREEKLDILRRVDKVARAADQRVQEVSASLSGVYELILVAATDGTLAADVRPLVRFRSACWWKRMANASAAAAAAAGVLAMTISSPPGGRSAGRCLGERSGAHGAGQPLGGRRPGGDAAGGARRRLAWRPAA
jgi:TldD protein